MPTVNEIIAYAEISQYLAANELRKAGLFGDGIPSELPRLLYMVRKSVQLRNQQDSSDETLTKTSNYLLTLCGKFGLQARHVSGTAGIVVIPSNSTTIISPIRITNDDFVDATHWDGQNSLSVSVRSTFKLQVFANFVARFLEEGSEWERTATGIDVLLPGFDATTNQYEFYIYLSA